MGVWTDIIKYWVLTNEEVKSNPYTSHPHLGDVEYQIGVTEKNIPQFDRYLVDSENLQKVILNKIKNNND